MVVVAVVPRVSGLTSTKQKMQKLRNFWPELPQDWLSRVQIFFLDQSKRQSAVGEDTVSKLAVYMIFGVVPLRHGLKLMFTIFSADSEFTTRTI